MEVLSLPPARHHSMKGQPEPTGIPVEHTTAEERRKEVDTSGGAANVATRPAKLGEREGKKEGICKPGSLSSKFLRTAALKEEKEVAAAGIAG